MEAMELGEAGKERGWRAAAVKKRRGLVIDDGWEGEEEEKGDDVG